MTHKEEIGNAAQEYAEEHPMHHSTKSSFVAGAKWADKTMLEKVIEWLDNNLCCYIGAQNFSIEHDRLNKDLRKDMGL